MTLYKFKANYIIPGHGWSYSYFATFEQAVQWVENTDKLPNHLKPLSVFVETI